MKELLKGETKQWVAENENKGLTDFTKSTMVGYGMEKIQPALTVTCH